ncbi:ATP-binding protein [Streptomyces laculatispora]|uniref:ATP-binding protein n=1 Tax=Streptomyces laculatispora TaxID=887464 RepID=A0ABY9I6F8_9ACTN|nr:ATP-binding protein [Streptomyces laculatispora]WLQ42455.1 ATP-binding protein [Streptomyces laculatispora]
MNDQCATPDFSTAEMSSEAAPPPLRAADAREAAAVFAAKLSPAPSTRAVQNLVLLSSELVTNAIRYAGGVTALSFGADQGALHVRVVDPSPTHPQCRVPDLTGRTGGFGWPMVLRLASRVTIHRHGSRGKTILATLAR